MSDVYAEFGLLLFLLELRVRLPQMFAETSLDKLAARIVVPAFPAPAEQVLKVVSRSERIAKRIRLADTCLYRALARHAALASTGTQSAFVMGVADTSSNQGGHAWVEVDGNPVGEDLEETFEVTFRSSVR